MKDAICNCQVLRHFKSHRPERYKPAILIYFTNSTKKSSGIFQCFSWSFEGLPFV